MSALWLITAAALGAVAGCLSTYYDLAAWLLHCWARLLGAFWFTPRLQCPKCGRHVHVMRHHPDGAGIFGMADGGARCLSCSGRSPRNAPQDAPGRTESAEVGLNVLGWPGAPESTRGHAERPAVQDRPDERDEQ